MIFSKTGEVMVGIRPPQKKYPALARNPPFLVSLNKRERGARGGGETGGATHSVPGNYKILAVVRALSAITP